MTVYKVGNVYYNDESIQQYIQQNHSFSDFVTIALKDESGNLRGILNDMFTVWNSDKQDDVVNYLGVLNYMYVAYINNILSNIPKYTVLEGGQHNTGLNPNNISEDIEPVNMQPQDNEDE